MEEKRVLMIRIRAGEEKKKKRGRSGGGIGPFKWARPRWGRVVGWKRQAVWHGELFRSTIFGERARTTAH